MINIPSLYQLGTQLRANKNLGQNFLLDQGLCDQIARGVTCKGSVVEIGPGPGGLTRSFLSAGYQVIAIDYDQRMISALEPLQQYYPQQLSLSHQDALSLDWNSFPDQAILAGNLPFNIATPLLLEVLAFSHRFSEILFMFQAEVAKRITATANTKQYGRLSILCQYMIDWHVYLPVSRTSFTPPPKVDALVIHGIPRKDIKQRKEILPLLDQVVKICFAQRRKTISRNLKTFFPDAEYICKQAEINPKSRAESLTEQDFLRLIDVITPARIAKLNGEARTP